MDKTARKSALVVLIAVAACIFISELVVMIFLSVIQPLSLWREAVLDSLLLILVLSPILYLLLFRPLVIQIEERRRTENKLNREKENAQMYIDVAGVLLMIIDADGKVLLINKYGLGLLGYTSREVIGKDWFTSFIPDPHRAEMRVNYYRFLTGEEGLEDNFECPVLTKYGHEKLIAWHNALLRDGEGNHVSVLSSGRDITERKRIEERLRRGHEELEKRVDERTRELSTANLRLEKEFTEHKKLSEAFRENELRFRSVLQSANDAIISADKNGKIISWNEGARRIFGYGETEALGKPLTMLMPERYRSDHMDGLERINRTSKSNIIGKTLEFSGLKKDGAEFPIELSIGTWNTPKGLCFSGIIRDLTVRKRIEEEKDMIHDQLVHSQKLEAIGRLIVGVAHDFSNIILSIKGYARVTMKKLGKDDPIMANLMHIQQLVDRGSNITHQLLIFGRKQPVNFTVLDINETIESLLKLINHLIRGDIKVVDNLSNDVWKIRADKGNIEQVLMNLIVNANDAMPDGGMLTITSENVELDESDAKMITEARSGDYVCVSVTDTGVGMDKTVSDRIFDPFFTTKGQDGSGLGLSVVYGVIRRHNGWINVDSSPNRGTTFNFWIPAYFPISSDEEPAKDE